MAENTPLLHWHTPVGKSHLLAIGINKYQHCGQLTNAVSDAQEFVQLMLEKYQFEEDRVMTLYDEEATKNGITLAFRSLIDRVEKDLDSVIVYFSGHGYYDKVLNEGYWVPIDAEYHAEVDYLSYSYLTKLIKALPTKHTFFIVDSCYSGAMMVQERSLTQERFEKDPSRWMLASGRNEVVPDGEIGSKSPFAEQLIDTLTRNADHGVRVSDLVNQVTTAVSYNSPQTPIGRPIYGVGDKGGEFFFRPKNAPPPDYGPSPADAGRTATGATRSVSAPSVLSIPGSKSKRLDKKRTRTILQIVVAALLVITAVTIIATMSGSGSTAPQQLTVYVHGPQGHQDIILDKTGTLVVDIGNRRERLAIGEDGKVTIPDIPGDFLGENLEISIEADGYEGVSTEKSFVFDGNPVYFAVQPAQALGKIEGVVKDLSNGKTLAGMKVTINNKYDVETDASGRFTYQIPSAEISDHYDIQVQGDKYKTKSLFYYPQSGAADIRLSPVE